MKRAVWIRDFVERVECSGTGSHGRVRLKERMRSFSAGDIRKSIRKVVVSLRLVSAVMDEGTQLIN